MHRPVALGGHGLTVKRDRRRILRYPETMSIGREHGPLPGLPGPTLRPWARPTVDTRATARLLLARELRTLPPWAVEPTVGTVAGRLRPQHRSPRPRFLDRVRLRTGRASHLSAVRELASARRDTLGDAVAGTPRLLVRVDEFPYAGAHDEPDRYCAAFETFDGLMAEAGVPYLLAVTPRVARDYLSPGGVAERDLTAAETEILERLPRDRVAFALHGLDHRTRTQDPRRRSEFAGLEHETLGARLDGAHALLEPLGIDPRVLVPPYNHFDARQYDELARRYEVICGGPETVRELGLQAGPVWAEGAVLLPSYPPVYGDAEQLRAGVWQLCAAGVDLWVPLVVHWEWEIAGGFANLRRLLEDAGPLVEPWDTFLDELRWSRDGDT